jgi:hypothetical protein
MLIAGGLTARRSEVRDFAAAWDAAGVVFRGHSMKSVKVSRPA